MDDLYQRLFQKLPEPYGIKPDQIRASYQFIYDKLLNSYKNNDFIKIYNN